MLFRVHLSVYMAGITPSLENNKSSALVSFGDDISGSMCQYKSLALQPPLKIIKYMEHSRVRFSQGHMPLDFAVGP